LRFLGRDEFGYDDESFLVRIGKGKQPTMVAIPFDQIGQRPTITCQTQSGPVPLLVSLLAVTALEKGIVPIHAGAFVWDDKGVLVVGWSKGGKTEALLAATGGGASYVGDEWCYVGPGGIVLGIPEPVTLWPWHLEQRPDLRQHASWSARAKATVLDAPDRFNSRFLANRSRTAPIRLARTLAWHTRSRASMWIPPERLFGRSGATTMHLDRLVLATSWANQETVLKATDSSDIAKRMAASVRFELKPLLDAYTVFQFAFPDRSNPVLDQISDRILDGMVRVLNPIEAFELSHPYPVEFDSLASRLSSVVDEENETSQ
jgi:hypothetical protein